MLKPKVTLHLFLLFFIITSAAYSQEVQPQSEATQPGDQKIYVDKKYFESGELQHEITYSDGFKNGIARFYYKQGQIKNEVPYKDGKRNGTVKSYFPEGELASEVEMENDKLHGSAKFYYEDGSLREEMISKQGAPVTRKRFDKEGNILPEKEDGVVINEIPPKEPQASQADKRYTSPQDVFSAWVVAEESGDWPAIFNLVTPNSYPLFIEMALDLGMMYIKGDTKDSDIQKNVVLLFDVFERFGLREDAPEGTDILSMITSKDVSEQFDFYVSVMNIVFDSMQLKIYRTSQLEGLVIKRRVARATIYYAMDNMGKSLPPELMKDQNEGASFYFRKINGYWYIDYQKSMRPDDD